MKRFLLALVAFCLLAVSAASDDRLAGFGMGGTGGRLTGFWQRTLDPTYTFIGCTSSTSDATAYTFSAHAVGAEGVLRKTLVLVALEDATAEFGVSTLTVGGASAGQLRTRNGFGQTATITPEAWIIDNPAGTAENIVVTASEAVTSAVICVYAVYNLNNTAPIDTQTGLGAAGAAMALNIHTRNGAVVFAICVAGSLSGGHTWSALTEDADSSSAEIQWSAAAKTATLEEAELSSTCDTTSDAVDTVGVSVTLNSGSEPRIYRTACAGNDTDLTTFNETLIHTGLPRADRLTIVQVAAEDSATNFNFTSLAVGGGGATQVNETATAALMEAATYQFVNTAGSVETMDIVMSEAVTAITYCVYAAYGLNSTTAVAQLTDTDTAAGAVILGINTSADGVVAAYCGAHEITITTTWVGAFEESDVSTGEASHTVGLARLSIPAETPRTISCDYSGTTADVAGTSVSYR